ncbi:MAG TPA: DUF1080 domain-containing protein [Candidatus Saccharimonadales bacterium]|nr:DUF1080 domain-containing protein [Candidatus Saccharimonadales bacterium]
MKTSIASLILALVLPSLATAERISLFDGKTFAGWEGDTNKTWRIVDGAIVGGNLKAGKVPHNEFICTKRQFTNFILRVKFKLVGTEGFVNGGVQFRSQRVPNHFEVSGYQADMGDGWWGCLYDESRRNKVLVKPDAETVNKALKKGEWNDYEIRCEGKQIRLAINGTQTVDYTEADEKIPSFGILGMQVHGGGITEAYYKDISIEPLP